MPEDMPKRKSQRAEPGLLPAVGYCRGFTVAICATTAGTGNRLPLSRRLRFRRPAQGRSVPP